MKVQNTFSSGLNSDISSLKTKGNTYLYSQNFRIVSQEGSSTYALENTKGQTIAFKLPSVVNAIYKVDPQLYTGTFGLIIQGIFTGEPTYTIPNIENYSAKQLYEFITNPNTPEGIAGNLLIAQGYYTVEYNNNYLVIVGLDQGILPAMYGTVVATGITGPITPDLMVAEIDNPQIMGAINIKDYIIIFSTPNSQNPVSFPDLQSTGQIWRIRYDENTNLISGLINDTLVPSVHLKKHDNFNWTQWRKISGEGRYEYEESQKVYFTDNFNNARLFNTTATNSFAIPLEVIDIKPLHNNTIPIIQSVNGGGFIKNGRIQYFYNLQSNLGTETTFSNASGLVSLTSSSLNSSYQAYQGGIQGEISGKSVTLLISSLDINYDNIKVGYILWESEDVATVRIFYEASVPPSGEVLLTHSGSEDEIAITLEQYTALQAAFDKCKGFTQKKNILLAFNTHTNSFNVDIDCRAYRFSGIGANNLTNAPDQTAYLYNKEDAYGSPSIIIDGATSIWYLNGVAQGTDWTEIPEEHDLINPYNQEDNNEPLNNGDWFNNSQFKYQADGSTLGGQGPIVKYNFIEYSEFGDVAQPSTFTVGSTIYSDPLVSGYTNAAATYQPGNGYTQPVMAGLMGQKNPMVHSVYNGYARGEIYRIANVFENQKGLFSFGKWIGDVKFPMVEEGYELWNFITIGGFKYPNLKQLGINITLNTLHSQFTTVEDEIYGWKYVRMKRDSLDKTRLGTGILNPVASSVSPVTGVPYYTIQGITGSDYTQEGIIAGTTSKNIANFESPNFKFNIGNGYTGSDYIRHLYAGFTSLAGHWLVTTGYVTKYYTKLNTYTNSIVPLTNLYNVPVSGSQNIVVGGPDLPSPVINMGGIQGTGYLDWGGVTNVLTTVGISSAPDLYPAGFPTDVTHPTTYMHYRALVSYERYLTNQYNGNIWEARLGQEYIGTNHFQPWNNPLFSVPITSGEVSCDVWGGDVIAAVFDYQKFDKNIPAESGWDDDGGASNTNLFAQIFVAEMSLDIHLRRGIHAANKTGLAGERYLEDFVYNTAYSQQNTSQSFFTIPYNFNEINENPYRIWASQEKFDGEFPDAWANWKSSDFIDVEGTFGPLNQMVLVTDRIFYYQDYAIGVVAVKEQQLVDSATTTSLVLGEGTVLQRYDYLTKNTGCKHQWAVIVTPKGAYHADVSLKKIFLLQETGDKFGLTDLKGLNVEFQKLIQQRIKDTDLPLINGGVTIHGGWNPKHNEVFFTLLDNNTTNIGHIIGTGTTITYNELTETFDSFHKYAPSLYHRNQNHFLSINPGADNNIMWEHDTGSYNVYYGVAQPSTLKFTINLDPATTTKVLNIVEFITQVNETLANGDVGIDVPFDTISSIRISNSYQDTGVITLNPATNFKKRFKSFRFNSIRDYVNTPSTNPRQRDKTFTVEITYNNPSNHRLVMNDVISELDVQPY